MSDREETTASSVPTTDVQNPMPVTDAEPASPSRIPWLALVALLVSVLALAAAALPWLKPHLPPSIAAQIAPPETLGPALLALQERADGLASRLDRLDNAIATLAAPSAPATSPETAVVPDPRVEEVSNTVLALREEVSALAQTVATTDASAWTEAAAQINKRLTALDKQLTTLADTAAKASAVLSLVERIDRVEAMARELGRDEQGAVGALLAVAQLRQQVQDGVAFDGALRTLEALRPDDAKVQEATSTLRPYAATGIPTRPILVRRFDTLFPKLLTARNSAADDGFWDRTAAALQSVVTVRDLEADPESGSVDGLLNGISAALSDDDFSEAVTLAGKLEGGPAKMLAPWLEAAKARLAADTRLADLTAHAVALVQAARMEGDAP